MTNADLTKYYSELLINQYINKPKAYNTIYHSVRVGILYEILEAISNGFDIESAKGKQLDVLAKYVGVSREVSGPIFFTKDYFAYKRYSDPNDIPGFVGYGRYGEPPIGEYRKYEDSKISTYTLTDNEIKGAIKFAIIKNNCNGSIGELNDLYYQIFGDLARLDETNIMEITLTVKQSIKKIAQISQAEGYLRAPMGVKLILTYE